MRSSKLKLILGLIAFCFISKFAFADENLILFDSANASYSKGNYEKAIDQYESILNKNVSSAELYFNLGNAYFKINEIGLAILNYERAKKLSPESEDLVANLKLANQKTEDKIEKAPELFLSSWKNSIVDLFSEKVWSTLCVFMFLCALILLAIYILSERATLKKVGFFGGSFLMILTVITFFLAGNKYELTVKSLNAVITAPTATITGSPNEKGTKLFILHEGTKVTITQEQDEWIEVKIANGNVGWIKSTLLQKI